LVATSVEKVIKSTEKGGAVEVKTQPDGTGLVRVAPKLQPTTPESGGMLDSMSRTWQSAKEGLMGSTEKGNVVAPVTTNVVTNNSNQTLSLQMPQPRVTESSWQVWRQRIYSPS
jgi:hypothetical protein